MNDAKFSLGELVATPGVLAELTQTEISDALKRHAQGDWGIVNEEDKLENEYSLREGLRLLSAYRGAKGTKFLVITEADRALTSVLLAEDY